jgi:hypothetical protein
MPNWRKGVQGPQRRPKNFRKKKNARRNVTTLAKTNRRKINKMERELYAWRQYQITDVGTIGATVHSKLLTQPNGWQAVFQSADIPSGDIPRRYELNKVHIKYLVQTEQSAAGNMWFQCFIVSLKKKFARQTRERTSNLSSLIEDTDYIASDAGTTGAGQGLCNFMLNPALYRVHHTSGIQRVGQVTMDADTEVTNIRDSTYFKQVTIPFKRTFKNDSYEAQGFTALTGDTIKNDNILQFIMLSNSGVVTQTFLSTNCQFVGRTVAGS